MHKRHRIFIAINLPEEIKKELVDFQKKWPDLPARWTKPKNIHITLAFLGYLTDQELFEVSKIVKEVASKYQPFEVKLNKVCYGPLEKKPARMIWAVGEKSEKFGSLRKDLERRLAESQNVRYIPEKREFSPHITLARIRQWEFRRIEPEERPEINEDINFNFEVNSIEIMQSQLKRGGAEYSIFESFELEK